MKRIRYLIFSVLCIYLSLFFLISNFFITKNIDPKILEIVNKISSGVGIVLLGMMGVFFLWLYLDVVVRKE